MLGIIWTYDRYRYLTWKEYEYWMWHVLPFGWEIIVIPDKQ